MMHDRGKSGLLLLDQLRDKLRGGERKAERRVRV